MSCALTRRGVSGVVHRRRRHQSTPNTGRLAITLRPRQARSASAAEILRRLRVSAQGVEGTSVFFQVVQDLQIDSRVSRTQFQYTMEDADIDQLGEWARACSPGWRSCLNCAM